jgi:hypothetical protein
MKRFRLLPCAVLAAASLLPPLIGPAFAQQPAPRPDARETVLVQVIFLTADREGSTALSDLPANVSKAVEDIRDFLPYKKYALLDSAVMRTDGRAAILIDGPKEVDYEVQLRLGRELNGRRNVENFVVLEKHESGKVLRQLMDSSFSAALKETVVVGTSKLNGSGQALIALLTLLP